MLHQLVDQKRNEDVRRHIRRAHISMGFVGSRRSQHYERVKESSLSNGSSSSMEESTEESKREEGNQGDRMVAHRGKVLKPKIEFSKFNGDDPNIWISKAE